MTPAPIDPIVEELHQFREHHAAAHNYDLWSIFRDLKEQERLGGRELVREDNRSVTTHQALTRSRQAIVLTRLNEPTSDEEMEEFRETLREVRNQENGRYAMYDGEDTQDGGCI